MVRSTLHTPHHPRHHLLGLLVVSLLAYACSDPPPQPISAPIPSTRPDMSADDMDDMLDANADADEEVDGGDLGEPDVGEPDLGEPDMTEDAEMDAADTDAADTDMEVDMCEPLTRPQLCAAASLECGEWNIVDPCTGASRLEVCGECALPTSCLERVSSDNTLSTSCGCDLERPAEVCQEVGRLCGPMAPPCAAVICDEYCVSAVSAGGEFNCALGSGKARCWGDNAGGQLGLGNTTAQKNPASLGLSLRVDQLATGERHTCAILDDTSVICWGVNARGQLGIGTTVNQPRPDLTDPNSRAIERGAHKVVLGADHTCALVDDDFDPITMSAPQAPFSTYCWGSNAVGAIGNPDRVIINADAAAPILVKGLLNNVYDLAAGPQHNCVIVQPDGTTGPEREVRCWGIDEAGQLGARDINSAQLYLVNATGQRIKVAVHSEIDNTVVSQVDGATALRQHFMFNTTEDNRKVILAEPARVRTDRPASSISTESEVNRPNAFFRGEFVEIVAGRFSTCLRDAENAVWCWGAMFFAHATNTCQLQRVTGPPSLAGLNVQSCSAWPPQQTWSKDTVVMIEKLGTTITPYGLPQSTLLYRAIAPRPTRLMHHPDDPSIYPSYVLPGGVVRATQLSLYNQHLCMLHEEPTLLPNRSSLTNVYCLGNNTFGQLGDNTNSPIGYPVPLSTDINNQIVRSTQVDAGSAHSCAVAEDNNIKCWGSNSKSQIGNENLMRDESFKPFDVLLR